MDKEKLRQRLMGIFLGEFDLYLETLNSDLDGLRADPNGPDRAERVERLHRDSHGLKGAARSAGVPALQRAFLGLERLMAGVRDGQRPLDAEVLDLLASAAAALTDARQRLGTTKDASGPYLDGLLPRLEAVVGTAP
jgi:two-component system chemotaxis sensor kinase CheA